jgi:hypothetical protein
VTNVGPPGLPSNTLDVVADCIPFNRYDRIRTFLDVAMQPKQRVEAYLQYMVSRGVPQANAAPPLWTALWSVGIFLPPPPFLALPALTAISALLGALLVLTLWLVFGALALLRPITRPLPTLAMLLWATPIVAAFMAIANPIYYRRLARQHGLANWSTFAGMRQRA